MSKGNQELPVMCKLSLKCFTERRKKWMNESTLSKDYKKKGRMVDAHKTNLSRLKTSKFWKRETEGVSEFLR